MKEEEKEKSLITILNIVLAYKNQNEKKKKGMPLAYLKIKT